MGKGGGGGEQGLELQGAFRGRMASRSPARGEGWYGFGIINTYTHIYTPIYTHHTLIHTYIPIYIPIYTYK